HEMPAEFAGNTRRDDPLHRAALYWLHRKHTDLTKRQRQVVQGWAISWAGDDQPLARKNHRDSLQAVDLHQQGNRDAETKRHTVDRVAGLHHVNAAALDRWVAI